MTAQLSVRTRVRSALATATAGLLVLGGAVAAPTVAFAAEEPTSGATLNWGVAPAWGNYVTGPIASGSITAGAPATLGTGNTVNWVDGQGSVDLATGTGTVTYSGTMVSQGHAGQYPGGFGLNQQLANPQLVFSSATSATLSAEVTQGAYGGFKEHNGERVVIADLSIAEGDLEDGTATARGVFAATSAPVFGNTGSFLVGNPVGDVTFTLPAKPEATATTTSLTASATSVIVGDAIDLSATVAPSDAVGSVVFKNNGAALANGTVPVATGAASLSGVKLPKGANSLTAEFVPSDSAVFAASSSAAVAVQVNATPAVKTTVAFTGPLVGPVTLGKSVDVEVSVAAVSGDAKPSGKVEVFSVAAGSTDRVSRGSADVNSEGVATVKVSDLAQGGYSFVAAFTPADAGKFEATEQAAPEKTNLNVVDPAPLASCEISADASVASETATAEWGWSEYANSRVMSAVRVAEGNVRVDADAKTHLFENGVVRATPTCAEISFTGVAGIDMHGGTNWQQIIDPKLYVSADGSGVWTAKVKSGSNGNEFASDGYVTVASFDGADIAPGAQANTNIVFNFDGVVPQGTWSQKYTAAWPNSFLLGLDPAQRAYYYQTNENQAGKAPSALAVDFDWSALTATELKVAPVGSVTNGEEVALTATVAPVAAEGTVTFFATSEATGKEQKVGEAQVASGVATLKTSKLAAGGNALRAVFASSNNYLGSEAVSKLRVIDYAQAAVCSPKGGVEFTNVEANWGWSEYSVGWDKIAGGNIALADDGNTFELSKGTAIVADDCVKLAFTGTMRTEAYKGMAGGANGLWVEITDPELVIDTAGNGAWTGIVRSGQADLDKNAADRIVIAEIANAGFPDFTRDSVDGAADFAWAGVTAKGTWSAGQDATWSNAFVKAATAAAPAQSFYYATGAAGDVRKPAAPVAYSWSWAPGEPQVSSNGKTDGIEVKRGDTVVFTAGPFADRGADVAVEVHSEVVDLGTVKADALTGAAEVTWTVPADFELGEHEIVFTQGESTAKVSFTVKAAASTGGPETPGTDNGGGTGTPDTTDGSGTQTGGKGTAVAVTGGETYTGIIALGALVLIAGAATMLIARRRTAAQN
ncbi:HtaA domain-containing protein [Leucobacter sp. NPDC015123]|uniref:HtaA domain-containing protein n=1 Tax=Leucobacter sp. NPDC015123 TaxID=3364129 RepID=UPI0036F47324